MSEKINIDVVSKKNSPKKNNVIEPSLIAKQALEEARARKLNENLVKELNGPKGLEPTRYGDWERKGRCYDF